MLGRRLAIDFATVCIPATSAFHRSEMPLAAAKNHVGTPEKSAERRIFLMGGRSREIRLGRDRERERHRGQQRKNDVSIQAIVMNCRHFHEALNCYDSRMSMNTS